MLLVKMRFSWNDFYIDYVIGDVLKINDTQGFFNATVDINVDTEDYKNLLLDEVWLNSPLLMIPRANFLTIPINHQFTVNGKVSIIGKDSKGNEHVVTKTSK